MTTFFQGLRTHAVHVLEQQQRVCAEKQANLAATEACIRKAAYEQWVASIQEDPCGFCGSKSGYHLNDEGWCACNNCEGV